MERPFIVGIGGTTRSPSSVERLIGAVLTECAALGATTQLFGGDALVRLPHFSPESRQRSIEEGALVDAVRRCDGLVIGSPGYHGGISGLVKNAIDLLEDTASDERPYFDNLPVGLVVSAAGWQAGGLTLAALRSITHAMRGWPTPIGITANSVATKLFSDDGGIVDPGLTQQVRSQAAQIMHMCGRARPRTAGGDDGTGSVDQSAT